MHSGDAVPRVSGKTKMTDVIYEMSRKKLGITTVVEGEKLVGVISDGGPASVCSSAKVRT